MKPAEWQAESLVESKTVRNDFYKIRGYVGLLLEGEAERLDGIASR